MDMNPNDAELVDQAQVATRISRRPGESDLALVLRLLPAISKLSDDDWEELPDPICDWYNANANKVSSAEAQKGLTWPSGDLVQQPVAKKPPKPPAQAKTAPPKPVSKPPAQAKTAQTAKPSAPKAAAPGANGRGASAAIVRFLMEHPQALYDDVQVAMYTQGIGRVSKHVFARLRSDGRLWCRLLHESGKLQERIF